MQPVIFDKKQMSTINIFRKSNQLSYPEQLKKSLIVSAKCALYFNTFFPNNSWIFLRRLWYFPTQKDHFADSVLNRWC